MKIILFSLCFLFLFSDEIAIVGLNLPGHGLSQISQGLKKILEKKHKVSLLSSRKKNIGKYDISIFTDSLTCFEHDFSKNLPNSKINFAYCLWETDTLPNKWVEIINNKFDAVIVSAEWYIQKYINSGVNKPIFCIPLGLDQDKIKLVETKQKTNHNKFNFTCISSFFRHKNQLLLIEAFDELFHENKNVGLILSGHAPTYDRYYTDVLEKIKEINNPNILINTKQLNNDEFADLINKSAVIVSISTGEGYSYTPREAAVFGIPTIIAANTAYWDIIENNFASIAINCPITTPSYCVLQNDTIGNGYSCSKENLKLALTQIYQNYNHYKKLSVQNKLQVLKKYSWQELEPIIANFFNFKKWQLSADNKATKLGIFCDNANLLNKFKATNL